MIDWVIISATAEEGGTIMTDFGPEINPPFRWRSNHQIWQNHRAYQ